MKIKKIGALGILCITLVTPIVAMSPKRGRINAPQRTVHTTITHHTNILLHDDALISNLQGNNGEGRITLKNANLTFQRLKSVSFLSDNLQNEIQDLRNFVHTLVTDKVIEAQFKAYGPYSTYTENLLDVIVECYKTAKKCKQAKQKKHLKDAESALQAKLASITENTVTFLTTYSDNLVTQVIDAYHKYCEADTSYNEADKICNTASKSLTQAQNTYNQLEAVAHRAQISLQKAQTNYNKCEAHAQRIHNTYVALLQRKRDAYNQRNQPSKYRIINQLKAAIGNQIQNKKQANAKARAARHTVTQADNATKLAGKKACTARHLQNKALRDLHIAQMAKSKADYNRTKAYYALTDILYSFEQRTVYLLNNQACMRKNQLGRLPSNVILELFECCEKDFKMVNLVKHAQKLMGDNDGLMLTLQHYITRAYNKHRQIVHSAKGFSWELSVGLFLYETLQNDTQQNFLTFSTHLSRKTDDEFREFDATTSKALIEAKNIYWETCNTAKLTKQFFTQKCIADHDGREYIVISKRSVPEKLISWFNENDITFIDPTNAHKRGSVLAFTNGFENLYQEPYCF